MARALILVLSLWLGACSGWQRGDRAQPWLPVLAPAALGQSIAVLQKVSSERNGEHYVLLFQLEIEPERLAMVGSTSGGNTLFSLEYRNGVLTADTSPLLPAALDPAFVLSDFQLAFWPLAAIEQVVMGSAYRVRQFPGLREFYQGDELLARIGYADPDPWAGPIEFHNLRWDYRYRIETLEKETLTVTPVGNRTQQ